MKDFLKALVSIPGGSGFEEDVAGEMLRQFGEIIPDVSADSMGNVIARIGPSKSKKSVMVCAHTDEVGMCVKYIHPQGYIYFDLNGVIDERVLLGQKVDIVSRKGVQTGIIGVKGKHLLTPEDLKRPISVHDLWIDVGAGTAEQVGEIGIEVGDFIVYHPNYQELGRGYVVSKALDNRMGCAVLRELAKELKAASLDYTIYLVAATQEEIGSRGARVAAQSLRPDLALVIDTVPGADPATPPQQVANQLGQGPVIRTMDFLPNMMGTIYSRKIRDRLIDTAKRGNIPFQTDIFRTWTDAATVHMEGGGIPTGGIFIPRRCSHSPTEIAHIEDMNHAYKLSLSFLSELNGNAIEEMRRKI
jgi:putative aminopeptidase FrvX